MNRITGMPIDFKTLLYTSLVMCVSNCPIAVNMIVVAFITLLDIGFGLWKIKKTKEEFSTSRFLEGFVKIGVYFSLLCIGYLIDRYVIKTSIIGVNEFFLRGLTFVFIVLEARSIEIKRKACGKTPILEIIRKTIKVVKEIKVEIKSIMK